MGASIQIFLQPEGHSPRWVAKAFSFLVLRFLQLTDFVELFGVGGGEVLGVTEVLVVVGFTVQFPCARKTSLPGSVLTIVDLMHGRVLNVASEPVKLKPVENVSMGWVK